MAKAKKAPSVPCPQCGDSSVFSPDNPYRPFCSERCKLVDLGKWASEGYRVPLDEEPVTPSDQQAEG
jgi:uncharacterized protein